MRFATSANQGLDLARVLLVHGELAPRLTLQTLLQAGGYAVDVAGSSSEALAKLDTNEYELVLTDGTPGSGNLMAYARVKDYRPATAMVTASEPSYQRRPTRWAHELAIHTEGVPHLLEKVADLLALRASRRRYRAKAG